MDFRNARWLLWISFFFGTFFLSAQAEEKQVFSVSGLFSRDTPDTPPPKPYQLPTFNQLTEHYNDNIPALIPANMPDSDQVFQTVIACHPSKSLFNIDVELKGQISNKEKTAAIGDDGNLGSITSNYVAIVARMPLYSASEMHRARDKETDRRQATAQAVSEFIGGIAKRNHAIRRLALYGSLEKRSQIRVQKGISRTDEQVGYLEKVATAQQDFILHKQAIMQARLMLAAMCRTAEFARVNGYLKEVAQL